MLGNYIDYHIIHGKSDAKYAYLQPTSSSKNEGAEMQFADTLVKFRRLRITTYDMTDVSGRPCDAISYSTPSNSQSNSFLSPKIVFKIRMFVQVMCIARSYLAIVDGAVGEASQR